MPRQKKKISKKKHIPFWKISGALALLLIGGGLLLHLLTVSQPTFTQVPATIHREKKAAPTRVIIPSISLSLSIELGQANKGKWYVSPTTATFLQNGNYPGEDGPIILYGHNKKKIFGPLVQVKKGDIITLVTADKKIHSYTVSTIQVVSPYQIDVLEEKKETVIIFTCTGFADSKRLVVKGVKLHR